MSSGGDMKQQAQYIWDRLEDLSASDPDAYKSFIDKQMEEKKIFMSSPQAELCIHTSANVSSTFILAMADLAVWILTTFRFTSSF